MRRVFVAVKTGRAIAGKHRRHRSAGIRCHTKPLLVKLGERPVDLHALDDCIDTIAQGSVFLSKGKAEIAAGGLAVRDLQCGVFACHPTRQGRLGQIGKGAANRHRLHRIGVFVEALHFVAVLDLVLLQPLVGEAAVVDRDHLAFEVFKLRDLCALLGQKADAACHVRLGKQHLLGTLGGDVGGRHDHFVAARKQAGEDGRKRCVDHLRTRKAETLGHIVGQIQREAFENARRVADKEWHETDISRHLEGLGVLRSSGRWGKADGDGRRKQRQHQGDAGKSVHVCLL